MKFLSKLLTKIILAIVILYSALGFIVLPYFIQFYFPFIIHKTLHTQSYVDSIHINPFTFNIKISNLILKDQEEKNLLFFETLHLNLNPFELLNQKIDLTYLAIDNLKLSIDIDKNNETNYQYIIDKLSLDSKENRSQTTTKSNFIFSLEKLNLSNINFAFEDLSKQTPFSIKTKPINIVANGLQNTPDHTNKFAFEIDTFETGKINLSSDIVVEPLQIQGNLSLENIAVNKFFGYLRPQDLAFDIDTSPLNLQLDYKFDTLLEFGNLTLKNIIVSLEKGEFNMENLQIKTEDFHNNTQSISVQLTKEVQYQIENTATKFSKLTFIDKSKLLSLDFNRFENSIQKITQNTQDPILIQQTVQTPKGGELRGDFVVVQTPFKMEGKLETKSLNLTPYEPYIKDFLNIDLDTATLTHKSNFTFSNENNQTNISLKLNGDLKNIAIKNSHNQQQLLKIKTIDISELQLINNHLTVETVLIDHPYINFSLNDNNTTNFTNLVKQTNSSETDKTKQGDFTYKIDKITLQNGSSKFEDHTVTPHFISIDEEIQGDILNITSDKKEKTIITHKSIIDKYATLAMEANMVISNPLEYTTSNILIENIDLPSLSSYSGKFIGNKIAQGKLHLKLEYEIKDSILQSKNHLKIKDLKLGEKVESKDAINAPIGLAIALLKDNQGYIDLDVPISGDINNPKFHLSDVILDVITNTLVGIVSAPFKFLGLLLGISADDISNVTFDYGESEVSASGKESLDNLLKAFEKRPNLQLEIHPAYLEKEDTLVLQKIFFKQQYPTFFDPQVPFKEKLQLASKLYTTQFKEKETEKLPQEEIEKYQLILDKLQQQIIIDNNHLLTLANQRVQNIQQYLINAGLAKDRIVINNSIKKDSQEKRMEKLLIKFDLKANIDKAKIE